MILLVDDDTRFLEAAKQVISRDPKVLLATDAAHARTLLDRIGFSIALVDLDLPDCSGFQLIQEMHAARPELPIIAISGVLSGTVLESAKEFGAVEVLSKPATPAWKTTIERFRLSLPD